MRADSYLSCPEIWRHRLQENHIVLPETTHLEIRPVAGESDCLPDITDYSQAFEFHSKPDTVTVNNTGSKHNTSVFQVLNSEAFGGDHPAAALVPRYPETLCQEVLKP